MWVHLARSGFGLPRRGLSHGMGPPPLAAHEAVDVVRRRRLLQLGLTLGGAAVVSAVGLVGPSLSAAGPSSEQDAEIFKFALHLEDLQESFYRQAAATTTLPAGDLRQFVETVRDHEEAHAIYLRTLLGQGAPTATAFTFPTQLASADTIAATATMLEDLAVAAYNGQATNLTTAGLAEAAKIVSVDARHAAWIRSIVGNPPASQPTDPGVTSAVVTSSLQKAGLA